MYMLFGIGHNAANMHQCLYSIWLLPACNIGLVKRVPHNLREDCLQGSLVCMSCNTVPHLEKILRHYHLVEYENRGKKAGIVLVQTEQLERLVEKTAARIDRHVVSTLLDKYSIVSHCSAIKRYLLLSQVLPNKQPPVEVQFSCYWLAVFLMGHCFIELFSIRSIRSYLR